jgi:hypothetical protein
MSATRLIPADVSKEIRALLPIWITCVAVVWAGGIADESGFLFRAGFLVSILGSATLGALSVGHEYTNGTLSLMLTVPASRRRIFAIKAGVLLSMLLILALVAVSRLAAAPAGRLMEDTVVVGVVSVLGSAFLAPWLTIVCRNPLAGAVFSISIPPMFLLGSELLTLAVFGVAGMKSSMAQHFRADVLWGGMLLVSAFGAFSSWRAFMNLEAVEGPQQELWLHRWSGDAEPAVSARVVSRPAHPVWQLLKKEFHLQHLTFLVSGLYLCGWIAIVVVQRMSAREIDQPIVILTAVHGAIIALLSGSLASGEERNFGTLESQVLMPISMARQWAVKAGVVFGLCVVLALLLPLVLGLSMPSAQPMRIGFGFALVVICLASVSLYVSSVCNSGLQALLLSLPVTLFFVVLIQAVGFVVAWVAYMSGVLPRAGLFVLGLGVWATVLLSALFVTLLLRFALINHRSSDRAPARLWRQILWMTASMAFGISVAFFVV